MMRSERPGFSSGRGTRGQSFSSDASTLPGHAILSPPASVQPEPAYLAVSAASQLVSSELDIDGVTISPSALAQLNTFLDHILFNFLLVAKSTKLSLLKPAINSVLKPKLGRAALYDADEELREYLGEEEEEEDEDENSDTQQDPDTKREFDLELAWKLARLRCMVYSRIGDLEEDDEDEYIERENLDERGGRPRRFSSHPSRVNTASAIFLTSVIEFLAEQALAHAAQATQRRLSRSRPSQDITNSPAPPSLRPDRIVVSDADLRHLGRDSPLQKLWRGWRHQVRLPNDGVSRPISPELHAVPYHIPGASASTVPDSGVQHQPSVAEVLREEDPAGIPLPTTDNDVDEIEVPGFTSTRRHAFIFKEDKASGVDRSGRPRSLEISPTADTRQTLIAPDGGLPSSEATASRPWIQTSRSRSLPVSPGLLPQSVAVNNVDVDSGASTSRNAETKKYQGHRDAQQRFKISRSSSGDEDSAADTASATETPGTSSVGQTASEGQMAAVVPNPPPLPPAVLSGHRAGVPISAAAMSMHESNMEEAFSERPHPPRSSSKSSSDYGGRSPALMGSIPPVPKITPSQSETPPLTPLQVVAGQTPAGRHRNLSGASGVDAQKRQGQIIFAPDAQEVRIRPDSNSSVHTKSSSSSSKLLGFDREQQSAMLVGSERAAVQRIYPVVGAQEADQTTRPNTSHSTKEKRPGTASTHVSSLRPGTSSRGSIETALGGSKAQMSTAEQDEKKQSLENLIRSKETWKYTLTPQNMREMEAPDSPRYRTVKEDVADFPNNSAHPGFGKSEVEGALPRSPAAGMNGLRANPPGPMVMSSSPYTPVEISRPGQMVPSTVASPATKSFRSQHTPRDPKVEEPSTRDLADFAKSTGPEYPGQLPSAVSGVSTQPRRAKTVSTRFQPRDPVVKGASSDLIDFIREGPPGPREDGTHRIPRTIAPFRTTMDSDEINALGHAQDSGGRNSSSSNRDGSIVTKSTANSRTGLMDSTNRTAGHHSNNSNYGAAQASRRDAEDHPPPRRKQRRVRDPYAIDDDSDGEDDRGKGKPPQYEDESLIDFLRNTSPPADKEYQPLPLKLLSTNQAASMKKPLNGGFRERLKRTASTNSLNRITGARPPPTQSGPSQQDSYRSATPVRAPSPHLVKSGSRFDIYKPTQTTYAAHVERNRRKGSSPGPAEGRDEGSLSKFFSRKRRIAH